MAVELERVYHQICLGVEEPGDESELGERENEDEDFSHSLLPAELLDGDIVEFHDDGADSLSPNLNHKSFAVSQPSVQQLSRNPHSICNSGSSFEPKNEKLQMQQLEWGQLPSDGAFSEGWRDFHIAGNRQSNISGFSDTNGWPSESSFTAKTKKTVCDFSLWNFDPPVNANGSSNDCYRAPSSPSLLRLQKDYGIVSDHSDTSPTSVLSPALMSSSEGTGDDSLLPSRVNGVAHRHHFREENNKWKLPVSSSCDQTEDDQQSTDWLRRELSPPLISLEEKSAVDPSVFSISSTVTSPTYTLLSPNHFTVAEKKEIPLKSLNAPVLEKPTGVLSGSPDPQRPQHQSMNHVPLSSLNHVNPIGTSPNTILRENKEQANEARGNNMRLGKHVFPRPLLPREMISSEVTFNPPSSGPLFPGARKVIQNNIPSVEKQSIRSHHEREGSHGVITRSHAPCPSTFLHSSVPNSSAIHICNSSWPKKNSSLPKSFNGNASGSVRTVASSFRAEGGPGGLGRNGGDPSFASRGRCINQPAVNGGGGTGVFLPRTAAEVPVQLGKKGQRRSRVFLPSRLVATLGLNLDGNNNVILNRPNSPAFDAPTSPTAFVPQETSSSSSSSSSPTSSFLSH